LIKMSDQFSDHFNLGTRERIQSTLDPAGESVNDDSLLMTSI
jgi:hypothetical protein